MMILIFCAHSGQNNVQESARTAWSGIYWCIDMMNSPPVGKNHKGAERIFGYMAEEIIGKSVKVPIPREYHAEEDKRGLMVHTRVAPSRFPLQGALCSAN